MDHLGPFVGFGDEKFAEFRRQSAEHHAAEIGEFLFHFGIGERVVDRLVQRTNGFRRRAFRRVEPIKGADLVAGQEIGNARRVGQRELRAHGGGDAERTELPVADKADRARQVVEGRLHSTAQEIGIGAAVHAAIGNIVQRDVRHQLEQQLVIYIPQPFHLLRYSAVQFLNQNNQVNFSFFNGAIIGAIIIIVGILTFIVGLIIAIMDRKRK